MKLRMILLALIVATIQSCKKPIPEPQATQLTAPENNVSCLYVATGVETADVSFSWQEADNTDSYTVEAVQVETGQRFSKSTEFTFLKITLDRGHVYRWKVISKSEISPVDTPSVERLFYLEAERQVDHIPFPASLVSPADNESITLSDGSFQFSWVGSDLDNDIANFTLYVGPDEESLFEVTTTTASNHTLSLDAASTYYWQVKTTDELGSASLSSIYRFTTAP